MSRHAGLILAIPISALACSGCFPGGERGFHSSDVQLMLELESALKKQGVPFRTGDDGFIRYDREHETTVSRIRKEVAHELSGGILVKHANKASADYLKEILSSRKMKFRVEARDNGEWIRWYPENENQQMEMEALIAQRHFDKARETMASGCQPGKLSLANPPGTGRAQESRRTC